MLETFVSITRGACETQAIEGLTPLDVVRRSAATLDLPMSEMRWTAGRCQALYDEGRRAQARLARPLEPEARAATDALTTHAVACLDAAEDCAAAFRTHLDGYALNPRDVPLVRQVGAFDRSRARTCWRKRIDGLPREQRVLWLAELLDRERVDAKPDVAQCRSLLQEARDLVRPEDVDGGKNELRRTLLSAAASCLAKGGACAEGWAIERETRTRAPQSGEAGRWADRFERCKGQKPE